MSIPSGAVSIKTMGNDVDSQALTDLSYRVTKQCLDATAVHSDLHNSVMQHAEIGILRATLEWHNWNCSQAAKTLGLNRGTLRKKLKQYDIHK